MEKSFFRNIKRFVPHLALARFPSQDKTYKTCKTCKGMWGTISQGFVVDSRLRCCVVEKSFFRNIRRFEPHHSALAEVFGFSGFHVYVLVKRDGGGRRHK